MLGPESGQKEEELEGIRTALKSLENESPEEHRIYPYRIDMTELVGVLRNQSLFSRHRLVIVYEAHSISKKADIDILVDYLEDPSESSTLCLVSDEYHLDRRIEKVATKKRVKIYWELFENQKRSWIQTFFRQKGFTISPEAVELVLELVENDTADLRRECEKLVVYFDSGRPIGESEVEELLFHSKNENVFSLFERIAEADLAATLETFHAIALSGSVEPGQILGGLTWQVRRLLSFRRLKRAHYSDDDIARQLGIRGKRNLRTYQTGARNYSEGDLEMMFVRTTEYDALFREMRTEIDRKILELYFYELIVTRGASPLFDTDPTTQSRIRSH
jgi:DNA polymerase-3 subunit delta